MKEESEKAGLILSIQRTKIMASSPITSWQVDGETIETATNFIFLGSKITADGDSSNEMKGYLFLWIKAMTRQHIKKQRCHFVNKGPSRNSYGFSSGHVWMWEWTIKKAQCRRFDAFELRCWRRLESPLDCKDIKTVNPKGNKFWIFFGRTDAEAETPILWPPDVKN